MLGCQLRGLSAQCLHVHAHHADFPEAVLIEHADLVERPADIYRGKRAVLIELQAVLVVEVNAPQLAEGHGEPDFIGRIQACENGVRRFHQHTDTFWLV